MFSSIFNRMHMDSGSKSPCSLRVKTQLLFHIPELNHDCAGTFDCLSLAVMTCLVSLFLGKLTAACSLC